MVRIVLSNPEQTELRHRARDPRTGPRVRDRLEMVRLSAAGWSVPRIARHLGSHEQTVRRSVKA